MGKFNLHDWNDIRLLIAVAERGGFAGAGAALGMDQTTVSRRIGAMEAAIGRPLFTRRRSGATPTTAGLALLERARMVEMASREFLTAMNGLSVLPAPTVTIAASDGLLTYTIIPALLGNSTMDLPLDRSLIRKDLPALAFAALPGKGDITVLATNPGELPQVRGAVRVRRVGTMHFVPVASVKFVAEHPNLTHFDDLKAQPLIDVGIYQAIRALEDWNGLVASKTDGAEIVVPSTPAMYSPLLAGKGVTILPPYSVLYEKRLAALNLAPPPLAVSLWLIAHEDALREPAVRDVYDLLAQMFQASPWFREACISAYAST